MNTAEKHGVEPGSYLAELCPILSDWILSSKSDNTNRSYSMLIDDWRISLKRRDTVHYRGSILDASAPDRIISTSSE